MSFTFGSDPEFILYKADIPISAIGILPCKEKKITQNRHCFYHDNILAECAIKPAKTKEECVSNFREAFKLLNTLISPAKLSLKAFQIYPLSQIQHPAAKIVNCINEFCAYTRKEIINTNTAKIIRNTGMRSAGGHIHLGSEILTNNIKALDAILLLDLFLSPIMLINNDPSEILRKNLYGKAGRHRRPYYGIEYRVLSNFWLRSPRLVSLVYDLCEIVIKILEEETKIEYDLLKISTAINNNEIVLIKEFLPIVGKFIQIEERLSTLTNLQSFYNEWVL